MKATMHPLAIILTAALGQYNGLGTHCGPHIASSCVSYIRWFSDDTQQVME